MHVTVQFLSYARLTGTAECRVDLPPGATVGDLAGRLGELYSGLQPLAERAVYLVNGSSAGRTTPLQDGDAVLMLRVVGGG